MSLEGWPSPLALDGQQLSTCKWESERLLSPCEAPLQVPNSLDPEVLQCQPLYMAFSSQKSGWAQGGLGRASSGDAGLPHVEHFHLLLSSVSSVSSLHVASIKTPPCHQPCLGMSQPQDVFPGSFIALHKSATGDARSPRLIPMYKLHLENSKRGNLVLSPGGVSFHGGLELEFAMCVLGEGRSWPCEEITLPLFFLLLFTYLFGRWHHRVKLKGEKHVF